jgi:cell division protein FtsW (lipid II flippase)
LEINKTQARLLLLAGLFLVLYATAITLAPAARARSWQVDLRWGHWASLLLWIALALAAHFLSARWLPDRDPYLIPIAALLSGWGLLTIWRLYPGFGVRQSVWLLVTIGIVLAGLRMPAVVSFLRRYKYIWLTGGLLLTGLTLLFGTNPSGGSNQRLWLGCCGIYFQPSEPLKLLLIAYLAAYLADRRSYLTSVASLSKSTWSTKITTPLLPLLAPTLIMTGLALLLLVVQRDLGTAMIFLFIYASVVYVASGQKRILLLSAAAMALAGMVGYYLFEVVRIRVDAWVNPWADPSGRSYQIVQSLIAIANSGLLGRGPGMGSPSLVPIAHSDFIFAAITEETGLIGALALLVLIALLANRGLRIALRAKDSYQRYLAAGLTAYLVGQSILIIGGNLRLLPLTGVTLPFISYGGSSLLTSFLSLLLLIHISNQAEAEPAPLPDPRPFMHLNGLFLIGLGSAAIITGWWAVYRSPVLVARTDNPRRAITDRYVQRGSILDRHDTPLTVSSGEPGAYTRQYIYPELSAVLGYTDPVYGQSGLEAALDDYLRGLKGNSARALWWNHLLYGQPPPGLDVRLSLDLGLQRTADQQLGEHAGALALLNAETGEVLAMASHPTFDANTLEQNWENLVQNPRTPLFDRATLGLYPPGAGFGPMLLASAQAQGNLPTLPRTLTAELGGRTITCARPEAVVTWNEAIAGGCPGPVAELGKSLGGAKLLEVLDALGLYTAPQAQLPSASNARPTSLPDPSAGALGGISSTGTGQNLWVSPLQMALAAATLSSGGRRPAPYLASAVNTPPAGWASLHSGGDPFQALPQPAADMVAKDLAVEGESFWQSLATVPFGSGQKGEGGISWYMGGTLPDRGGPPLAIAVLLEEENPALAEQIGQAVLRAAMQP